MPTNPYFNNYNYFPEQSLIENIQVETIQIHGVNCHYLPRDMISKDEIFGEDKQTLFNKAFPIELYIDNFQGFEGQMHFLSKFGYSVDKQMTVQIAKRRFIEELGSITYRPREGDLIFFPFGNHLFEINFCDDEQPFFQFGTAFIWTLELQLFTYSYEDFETNVVEINDLPLNSEEIDKSDIDEVESESLNVIEPDSRNTSLPMDGKGDDENNPFGEY